MRRRIEKWEPVDPSNPEDVECAKAWNKLTNFRENYLHDRIVEAGGGGKPITGTEILLFESGSCETLGDPLELVLMSWFLRVSGYVSNRKTR